MTGWHLCRWGRVNLAEASVLAIISALLLLDPKGGLQPDGDNVDDGAVSIRESFHDT